jgi:hypothetical protein
MVQSSFKLMAKEGTMIYNHPSYVRFMASERLKEAIHLREQERRPASRPGSLWRRLFARLGSATEGAESAPVDARKPQEQCC